MKSPHAPPMLAYVTRGPLIYSHVAMVTVCSCLSSKSIKDDWFIYVILFVNLSSGHLNEKRETLCLLK